MKTAKRIIWTAGMLTAALVGNIAYAQSAQNGPSDESNSERLSVLQRPRPNYDALGAHVGSFILLPSAELLESYDTNVYATASDTKSDFFTTLRSALQLQSDWNNHALAFRASGDIKRYATRVSENNSNFATSVDGRVDVLTGSYLVAGAGYQLLHEDRSSPDAVGTANPVEYSVASANVGYVHQRGVVGARIDMSANSYDYKDAVSGTGVRINENDRDRVEYKAAPRISYEIVRGYQAFVQTTLNKREYASAIDTAGFKRSSKGYAVDVGTAIDLTRIINGEIYAGYLEQDYEDPRLRTASGFGFGSSLLWNITQLTSIRLAAAHTAEETTLAPASSFIQSAATLSAEHEMLRNFLLTEMVSYTNQEYQGVSRTDDIYAAGLGLKYLITRNFSARLDVTYSQRNSGAVNADYERVLTVAGLRLQF